MGTWILEVGRYADRDAVAVVIGTKREAEKAAQVITERRSKNGTPRDMVHVRVAPIQRVDQDGKVVR